MEVVSYLAMLLWHFVMCRWLPKSIHITIIAPWFSLSHFVFNIHNKHVRYMREYLYNVHRARVAGEIHDDDDEKGIQCKQSERYEQVNRFIHIMYRGCRA